MPHLDPPSQKIATAIAQENLNQIVANWRNDANMFGPWEDVTGPSFFARSAQLRCLQEAQSTNALNLNLPIDLDKAVDGLSEALEGHWHPHVSGVAVKECTAGCITALVAGLFLIDGRGDRFDG